MRALTFKQAGWAGLFALLISSGVSADPQPSPKALPIALPVTDGSAGEAADAGSNFDNLEIVGNGLSGKVAILRVGSQMADNNLLSVFAGLKNKTARRFTLEVETIYKDKAGNALNAGSWIPVTLKPHEEREYRSSAISEQAVDFLIRVRRAPSVTASVHE